MAESLILFVHGLGGDPAGTWGRFAQLVEADPALSRRFDCAFYEFPTSVVRVFSREVPPVQTLAEGLETEIRVRHAAYQEVLLVCHSLGGLVGRWYLYRQVRSGEDPRVTRLLLFAVPNRGSRMAEIGDMVSRRHRQLRQLTEDSDFINHLNEGWAEHRLAEAVEVRAVVAGRDEVVTPESAVLDGCRVDTVVDRDHRSLVKPESDQDLSFQILREFALSEPAKLLRRRPGAPDLVLSQLRVEDPPPHSEAGRATFELMNRGEGRAVMTGLHLEVTDRGPSEIPKLVEQAAPVPQYTYKVTLSPDESRYDVRQKAFGSAPPHSYDPLEVEAFDIELRSTEPQWYEFRFLVEWYDATTPETVERLESSAARIEFRPDIREIV